LNAFHIRTLLYKHTIKHQTTFCDDGMPLPVKSQLY
jgi:hypothetical protein